MQFAGSSFRYLCLFIVLIASVHVSAQEGETWVHIGISWDGPAQIDEINQTGSYAIISRNNVDYLINILSGEVLLQVQDGAITFSKNEQFVFSYQFAYEPPFYSQHHVLNLETGFSYTIDGNIDRYLSTEDLIISSHQNQDSDSTFSQIRQIETGEIIAEYPGAISYLSHEATLVVFHTLEQTKRRFRIVDRETDTQLAEFTYPIPNYIFSYDAAFNADDSLLALYFFPEKMLIVDTSTWHVLYTLRGGIFFSPDGQYIVHNNHAGYSDVQLIEAHTGEVLDEFTGILTMSHDGQYWIRGEALTYDMRYWELIDVATNEVVFSHKGLGWGAPEFLDEHTITIWDMGSQSTVLYDFETRKPIGEINGGFERVGDLAIFQETPSSLAYLQDWRTGETFATGQQIVVSQDNTLALVATEQSIEIYSLVSTTGG